jgi:hypothetical protein
MVWFWKKITERRYEDLALKAIFTVITELALKTGGIGHSFGLARAPLSMAEPEMIREIHLAVSRETLKISGGKKGGDKSSSVRRDDLREQTLDDLLRSGRLNAVPVYIEPEKLLGIFLGRDHDQAAK